MRTNNANFEALNQQPQRELRLVVEIEFDVSNKVYFTSHADIAGISGTVVHGVVKDLSSVSQKLDPINAVASIGAINFVLVDADGAVTDVFRSNDVANRGLRGSTARLYSGFRTLAWADYRLEQTQIVANSVTFDGTEYKIQCADIQRELRKDVFTPAKTKLAANFLAADSTMTVYDTSAFEMCPHGPSFVADSPGTLASPVKVGYLKLKYTNGWEIVRYTGKTATTFTGITHARFGSKAIDHIINGTPTEDNGIEVEEFIYLELPAPKLVYALQTGILLGQPGGSNTLPASWHSAIDPAFVDVNQTNNIGDAWYKPSDDTGFVVRFDGLTKIDCKSFIEKEVLLLMGAFSPINAAGQLGLRLQVRVLAGSHYVAHLTTDDIVSFGDVTDSLSDVHNEFFIQWGFAETPKKKDFFRGNELIDRVSAAKHKKAQPTSLKFKGLHASRHTESAVLSLFNGLRDRHAGPPKKNKLSLLPSKNNLEIGDPARVTIPQLRDFTAAGYFDRVGEVQGRTIDQSSQRVSVDMFYSTMPASAVSDLATGNSLPDSFYNSAGTALANVSGGSLTADTTVTGGSSLAATIRYVLGDLLIPAGRVLNLSGNVQIRVMGYLDIRGTVNITGGMGPGVAGAVGHTRGDGNLRIRGGFLAGMTSTLGPLVQGKYPTVPSFPVEFNGTTLIGVPDDLRGSGGATGGTYTGIDNVVHSGAGGGTGGGGAMFISRGGAIDPLTGSIVTSGTPGSAGANWPTASGFVNASAGSGAGGAPGNLLWLIDGNKLTATPSPINGVTFIAQHGATPVPTAATRRVPAPYHATKGGGEVWYSYYTSTGGFDAGVDACFRVQFIPKYRVPGEDYTLLEPLPAQTYQQAAAPTNADSQTRARRDLMDGDEWIETDAGNRRFRHNGSTWVLASAARLNDISADEAVLLLSSQATHIFSEFWDKPNPLERWELFSISGYANEFAVTTDGGSVTTGGAVAQLGNGSVDDRFMLVGKKLIPYDAARALRLRARFRRVSGNPALRCGLIGYAADGVTIVDVSGGTSNSPSNHGTMATVNDLNPGSTSYGAYDAFWSGHAGTGTNGSSSVRSTGKMHNNVRYVRPYFANVNGSLSSTCYLDLLVLEDVSVAGTAGRIDSLAALRASNVSLTQSTRSSGTITSADAGTTATVTVAAWSFQTGFGTVNYNSGTITGLSFGTKYYIYCNDPQTLGGAVTYLATTNYQTPSSSDDYVYVGVVTTVNDGGGGGVGGGGGGEWCVCVDSHMPDGWQAGAAQPGHALVVLRDDLKGVEPYHVCSAELAEAACVRLLTASGIELVCSESTPLTLVDGRVINVLDGFNQLVPVLDLGRFRWESVISIEPIGVRTVARIHCDGRTYAAGAKPYRYILTHNPSKP